MKPYLYIYSAEVVRIYDGDTIWVDLDLGLGIWMKNQPLRLWGINTPELRGAEREAGLAARDWLKARLDGVDLVVRTHKDQQGKYGRWLAELFDGSVNLNLALVITGHAVMMPGVVDDDFTEIGPSTTPS